MPTIKDVAVACGVSQATVSQVLHNGRRPVHPSTRTRVLEAARTLDYRPSALARGLAGKRMNTLGLAFRHGENPVSYNLFVMMVLDGVLSVATRRGQSTLLCPIPDWDAGEYPSDLSDGRCDGVLLLVPPEECALPEILLRREVPFVLVCGDDPTGRVTTVDVDNAAAAAAVTEHLLGLGHRRIAFSSPPWDAGYHYVRQRQAGYRRVMEAAGLYDARIGSLLWAETEALDWAGAGAPTALFCAYDAMALSMIEEFGRRGLRVPDDISVIGFDDIPVAAACLPPLTTVHQPMTRLGARGAELLLSQIDGTSAAGGREYLPIEMILRASTAPPRCEA